MCKSAFISEKWYIIWIFSVFVVSLSAKKETTMEEREGRYINPYTDYGFKYLFGTEPNKEFTLDLINALLRGKEVI